MHITAHKPICVMTSGQCKSITLIVCVMLLQEDEAKIVVLELRLKKEQKGKADAEVSFPQAALLPAVMPSHDQTGFVSTNSMPMSQL